MISWLGEMEANEWCRRDKKYNKKEVGFLKILWIMAI